MTTPPDVAPIGNHDLVRLIDIAVCATVPDLGSHTPPETGRLILALVARLSGAEARQQWRPISDAPRDGTNIDVWVGGEFPRRIADVSWREPTDSEWWVHGGDTIDVPDATWFDGFGPLGRDQPPTHWLPLPPPPEGAA